MNRSSQKNSRRLFVQPLESRKMMAGDVTVEVDYSGSRIDVEITGDHLDNGIEVREISDILEIRGLQHDGTATTVNGQDAVLIPTKSFSGGTWRTLDDLVIKLGDGDDYALIRDVNMQHHSHSDLIVETGKGDDRITMMDTNVLRDMKLRDHSWQDGDDYWWMRNVNVGRKLEADMGDGNDVFVASYTDADELDIETGRHDDYVSLFGIDVDELEVDLDQGDDTLRIDASSANTADLDGGQGGNDRLDVNGRGFYANTFDAVLASDDFEVILS
ncbi:MAG: hypothetical protein AAF802_21945 [Planctomycetota bacterium]